ncbi:myb-like protein A isoform X2 [Quercus lobata]|uniref:myb-like protein A isoform X2 n=1 Tax=Quercus lobata TaxID=97700 RepID=UPI00124896D5|nr:myb-like protein A isoform X2 [Quercus lobata]
MELNGPTRFRPRKSTSSERFLGAFTHAPHENPSFSTTNTATTSNAAVELNEDDVFWTGSYSEPDENQNHNQHHSTSPSTPRHHNSNNHQLNYQKSFAQPEANGFGILAALPENETSSPSLRNVSHFYHKASVSSSSSSSSSSARMIPAIPKPPVDRMPLPSSVKYQSAPVNVPVMSQATRSPHEFDDVNDDDDGVDGEMLPPHEIVARAQSPMLACSVLEGAGRTLKGRDLRRVRNAVWRRTGG